MLRLDALNACWAISFPADAPETEFEIQAQIFAALRNAGFKVRGEVAWMDKKTREHCRFDLVVYDGMRPAHIIEVKARSVRHKAGVEATRQGKRYRCFGIPVSFVYGLDHLEELVQMLRKEIKTCWR